MEHCQEFDKNNMSRCKKKPKTNKILLRKITIETTHFFLSIIDLVYPRKKLTIINFNFICIFFKTHNLTVL